MSPDRRVSATGEVAPPPWAQQWRGRLPELPPALQRVGHVLLDRLIPPESLTIESVAAAAGVSPATVVRFSRDVGYRGFKELKVAILRLYGPDEALRSPAAPPEAAQAGQEPGSPAWLACRDTLQKARAYLAWSLESLDPGAVEHAACLLARARLIVWFGVGASGLLANAADFKFSIAGFNCRSAIEPQVLMGLAPRLGPGDVLVVFSHSGKTKSVLDPVEHVRSHARPSVIAATDAARSPLTRLADVTLVTADEPTRLPDQQPITFRPSQEALINALLLATFHCAEREGVGRG
ncbi:MAG: MurR/RpiR family transcriptional regulator [Bacillota bacterium]